MHIRRAMVLASLAALAGGLSGPACAGPYARIHAFCSETNCDDGATPQSPLLVDSAGNLYGTAYAGGTENYCGGEKCGTLFELKAKAGGGYRFSVLHDFCSETNCADGVLPFSGVIMDVNGHLYGTTSAGGQNDAGTAFELAPRKDGTSRFKLLYTFCMERPYCNDGAVPEFDGLTYQGATNGSLYDATSPLYGTTQTGGADGKDGVVYALNPPTTGTKTWTEQVLYNFCSQTNCTDGSLPQRGLLVDASGNLYGTTSSGGAYGNGVIFELSQSGGSWSETALYSFCPDGGSCTDGTYPGGPLMMDSSGNLYGVASQGGSGSRGVLYKVVPDGAASTYTVLYAFCSQTNCTDGAEPTGKLVMDSSGEILGVTGGGGANNAGIVYAFDGSNLKVLHAFCHRSGCADGGYPLGGGVSADASGNLYGTGIGGGGTQQFAGMVFRLAR